jgi:hypothetical protein
MRMGSGCRGLLSPTRRAQVREKAALQQLEHTHQREREDEIDDRRHAEGLGHQQVVGVDIARHPGDVHQRDRAGDGGGMHQADHLVAVLGQGPAQRTGQQHPLVQR